MPSPSRYRPSPGRRDETRAWSLAEPTWPHPGRTRSVAGSPSTPRPSPRAGPAGRQPDPLQQLRRRSAPRRPAFGAAAPSPTCCVPRTRSQDPDGPRLAPARTQPSAFTERGLHKGHRRGPRRTARTSPPRSAATPLPPGHGADNAQRRRQLRPVTVARTAGSTDPSRPCWAGTGHRPPTHSTEIPADEPAVQP